METKLVNSSKVRSLEDLNKINIYDILIDDSTIFKGKKLIVRVGTKSLTVAWDCQGAIIKQKYNLIKQSNYNDYLLDTDSSSAKFIGDNCGFKKKVLELKYI